jgi:hypothetical protein
MNFHKLFAGPSNLFCLDRCGVFHLTFRPNEISLWFARTFAPGIFEIVRFVRGERSADLASIRSQTSEGAAHGIRWDL